MAVQTNRNPIPTLMKVEVIYNPVRTDSVASYKFVFKGDVTLTSVESFCLFVRDKTGKKLVTDTVYRRLNRYKKDEGSLDDITIEDLLDPIRNTITYRGYRYESLKALVAARCRGVEYRKFLNLKHRLKREKPNLSGDDLIDATINSLNAA